MNLHTERNSGGEAPHLLWDPRDSPHCGLHYSEEGETLLQVKLNSELGLTVAGEQTQHLRVQNCVIEGNWEAEGRRVNPKILLESDPPSDWTWQGSNLQTTALALRSPENATSHRSCHTPSASGGFWENVGGANYKFNRKQPTNCVAQPGPGNVDQCEPSHRESLQKLLSFNLRKKKP